MVRKGKETTTEERNIVINMYKQKTLSEIASTVNRSRTIVFYIIKRFKETQTLVNKPRSGAPSKLTTRDKTHIVKMVKQNPRVTASEIRGYLEEHLGTVVNTRTVQHVTNSAGYHTRLPRRKPFISKKNQKKPLEFAKEHVAKPTEFWDHVLWLDESKFCLYKSDGHITV